MNPGDEVTVVGNKSLQLIGLFQADTTLISLGEWTFTTEILIFEGQQVIQTSFNDQQ